MNDEFLQSIVGVTDESNKKKVICQCAATIYTAIKDVSQSVELAKQIADKIYATV